jgi:putative ABC transport system permease protein
MNSWIKGYAYRTNITIEIFLLSAGLLIFIAMATVGMQAIKAAVANPVKSLRTE